MSVITTAPTKPLITGGLPAAAGEFAGVSLVVNGAPIPVSGFAVLTAIFSVVGLALALMLTHVVAAAIVIPAIARRLPA